MKTKHFLFSRVWLFVGQLFRSKLLSLEWISSHNSSHRTFCTSVFWATTELYCLVYLMYFFQALGDLCVKTQLQKLGSSHGAHGLLPFSGQFVAAGGWLPAGLLCQSEYLEHVPCKVNHYLHSEIVKNIFPSFSRVTLLVIAKETDKFRLS